MSSFSSTSAATSLMARTGLSPALRCDLCPKACVLHAGERGECRIRVNLDGELRAVTYGLPSAVNLDPVEKKPLYHFHPAHKAFSIATAGCNLHCANCQNWTLSQADPETIDNVRLEPDALVAAAQRVGATMIAFTYSEPLVYYEYTLDGGRAARKAGLDPVLVSAGYANPGPLRELYRVISAATIDVKAFDDAFYRKVCQASLKPVLEALVLAKEAGVWLEVSNLVIPTLNDSPAMFRPFARWMVENLGADTPLHLLRYFPRYRLKNLPPTPASTLGNLADEARAAGLHYVYIGNVEGDPSSDTHCPHCNALLVRRVGYVVMRDLLGADGRCPECGTSIAGVWT